MGKLSPDATKISGTWSQGGAFFDLDFKRGEGGESQPTPGRLPTKRRSEPRRLPTLMARGWVPSMPVGVQLRVVFHILNTADGLTATVDSPDQGVNGVPARAVMRKGSSLKIDVRQMRGGAYEGKIRSDLETIDGTYTWNGGSSPSSAQAG